MPITTPKSLDDSFARAVRAVAAMAPGLVAVPSPTVGGFHIYMTGGMHDPSRWLRGTLRGFHYLESMDALQWEAKADGRTLRKVRDYYALEA